MDSCFLNLYSFKIKVLSFLLLTSFFNENIAFAAPEYRKFSLHTGTALQETGNNVAFCLAPNRDLFFILKSGTGTRSTEVHVLTAASNYQEFSMHTGTALSETGDNVAFCLASNRDLFFILKSGTGTKSTEVHVLTAASNYQEFSAHSGTALSETGDNVAFCLAPNRDLFFILKSGTGTRSTEVHVLSAASDYKQFICQTGTGLHETHDNFAFCLAENRDLYAIKKSQTGTGFTEVHVLSAASNYQHFSKHTRTSLHETDGEFDFALAPNEDLFIIKKSGTGTHSTELHALRSGRITDPIPTYAGNCDHAQNEVREWAGRHKTASDIASAACAVGSAFSILTFGASLAPCAIAAPIALNAERILLEKQHNLNQCRENIAKKVKEESERVELLVIQEEKEDKEITEELQYQTNQLNQQILNRTEEIQHEYEEEVRVGTQNVHENLAADLNPDQLRATLENVEAIARNNRQTKLERLGRQQTQAIRHINRYIDKLMNQFSEFSNFKQEMENYWGEQRWRLVE